MNADIQNKKQFIAEKYLELSKEMPVDRITVKRLIEACGLSRQTFYYHFKDIPDVVEYLIGNRLDQVCGECIKANDLQTAIRIFLQMVWDNRKLLKRLEKSARSKDYWRFISKKFSETLTAVLSGTDEHEDLLRSEDMKLLISLVAHGVIGVIYERIAENKVFDIDRFAEQLYLFHQLYQGDLSDKFLFR